MRTAAVVRMLLLAFSRKFIVSSGQYSDVACERGSVESRRRKFREVLIVVRRQRSGCVRRGKAAFGHSVRAACAVTVRSSGLLRLIAPKRIAAPTVRQPASSR